MNVKTHLLSTVALIIVLVSYAILLASVNHDASGTNVPIGFLIGFIGFDLSLTATLLDKFRRKKVALVTFVSLMLSIIPLLGFLFMAYTILRTLFI
jgi:hypothetical protein